jgi:hypothetical protein
MVSVNLLFPSGKGREEKIVSHLPRSCHLEKNPVFFSLSHPGIHHEDAGKIYPLKKSC